MKSRAAILIGVAIAIGGVTTFAVLYDPSIPGVVDDSDMSPLERQSRTRRAYARSVQDSMRDQGAGRITIDTTDYGDVTLRLDMSGCSEKFLSDFTASPTVQSKLRELRFSAVMCKDGTKIYSPFSD